MLKPSSPKRPFDYQPGPVVAEDFAILVAEYEVAAQFL